MAEGALRKHKEIRFGELPGNKTADFEPDESQFFSWREVEGGERVYHYYVWLGVCQRGAPEKLWLKERGVTTSHGEGRMPPLEVQFWHDVCDEIFNDNSNMVCMSDSAIAYTSKPWGKGIVDAHPVNHSQKPHPEFARSVDALGDVFTKERRAAVASTCLIDPIWRRLKAELPQGSVSAKTPEGRYRMQDYIRTGQWKVMLSTYERWGPFCEAARQYEISLRDVKSKMHPSAFAVAKRLRRLQGKHVPRQPRIEPEYGEMPQANVMSTDAMVQMGNEDVFDVSPTTSEDILRQQSMLVWGDRFFERQIPGQAKCGQHALNNIIGGPQYDDEFLEAAWQTVEAQLPGEPERLHRRADGWYSHSVLAAALDLTMPPMWRLLFRPVCNEDWKAVSIEEEVAGVLVNVGNVHWSAIVRRAEHVFYVDSLYLPHLILQKDFERILELHPMSFLIVKAETPFPHGV